MTADYPVLDGICEPWSLTITFDAGKPSVKYALLVAALADSLGGVVLHQGVDGIDAGSLLEVSFLSGALIRLRLGISEGADVRAVFERLATSLEKFGVKRGYYEP